MDDPTNVLLNAALVAALTPILVAVGNMLKVLPPFKTAPEWLTPANVVIGAVIAVGYTWSRGATAGTGPTAVELTVALLSGAGAGLLSSHVYDATRATLGTSMKAQARRERIQRR